MQIQIGKVANKMNVTLLGPDIDHRRSLESMLLGKVARLSWMPDSCSSCHSHTLSERIGLKRAFSQLTHTHDLAYLKNAIQHIEENKTEILIAYWGTVPLPDIIALKRLKPQLAVVLMLLCFPLALDIFGIFRQHLMICHVAPYLSGILYPTNSMRTYVHASRYIHLPERLKEMVLNPCWPQAYQYHVSQQASTLQQPSLVFIGRTDLSSTTIHAADDIRTLMQEIIENRILLSHAHSQETSRPHPFRKTFEPMTLPALISHIGSFDASLIAYNTENCNRTDRFDLSVPDRLITSVAAGIPIAIPVSGYSGAKEYLSKYQAVIEFNSIANLKQQLDNRRSMDEMRTRAWNARCQYTAEAHGDRLAMFLAQL